MKASVAIEIMTDILGNVPGLESMLVQNLNLAKFELEHGTELPWFLITEMGHALTRAGDERLPVPTTFLRELEEDSSLWLYEEDAEGERYTELVKKDYDSIKQAENLRGVSKPKYYALVGPYFRLRPVPDAEYSIKMLHYASTVDISPDDLTVETPWLKNAPDVLIGQAGLWAAKRVRDWTALKVFQDIYSQGYGRMLVEHEARRQANLAQWTGMED